VTAAGYLARVEAAAEAATPGPWTYTAVMHSQAEGVGIPYVESQTGWPAMCQRSPDAAFIAAARTDVPALTAALRAVLALIEETRLPAPDGDGSILGGRVSATRLYAAVARELTP